MSNLINNALEFVKEFFKNDASGHDYYHTLRVYKTADKIAQKENADIEMTSIIALLHDVDDCKLVGDDSKSLKNAKKFLTENNVSENKINLICSEISKISFNGNGENCPDTLEGKIAQDADRLDALGAIGIARAFAYGGNKGRAIHLPNTPIKEYTNEKDYHNNNDTTINHFYQKLLKLTGLMNTAEAKRIAEKRNEFILEYLDEFFTEWNGND